MLAITEESRFADLLELSLYNGVLATISLDGKKFFYTNPLAKVDDLPFSLRWSRKRQPYIGCFCCPPNSVRTVGEVSAYAYGLSNSGVWINLYGGNVLDTRLPGGDAIRLTQRTAYPWESTIHITLESVPEREFSLFLRIPDWSPSAQVAVNEEVIDDKLKSGQYFEIRRSWSAGDRVELVLPMSVQLLEANPLVEETRNQVAVKRGPIVYCLESVDLQDGLGIAEIALTPTTKLNAQFVRELLGGISILKGQALRLPVNKWDETLYRNISKKTPKYYDVTLIPYYAWANRGDSEMTVWLPVR